MVRGVEPLLSLTHLHFVYLACDLLLKQIPSQISREQEWYLCLQWSPFGDFYWSFFAQFKSPKGNHCKHKYHSCYFSWYAKVSVIPSSLPRSHTLSLGSVDLSMHSVLQVLSTECWEMNRSRSGWNFIISAAFQKAPAFSLFFTQNTVHEQYSSITGL